MSNLEIVIDFSAHGTVEAMHMDGFDLAFLGDKKIERATEIQFNTETQTWGLFLPGGVHAGSPTWVEVGRHGNGFATYEEARQFEVSWLNICRARQLGPRSREGMAVLKIVRHCAPYNEGKPPTVEQYTGWVGTPE